MGGMFDTPWNSIPATDEPMLAVERRFAIYAYDIDAIGHVSNLVYVRWLEDLRTAWLDVYMPLAGLMEIGTVPVLTRTELDYRREIRLFQQVIGRMWIRKMEHYRVTLEAEISADGVQSCTARQFGTFINLERRRPVRIPEWLRDRWRDSVPSAAEDARG